MSTTAQKFKALFNTYKEHDIEIEVEHGYKVSKTVETTGCVTDATDDHVVIAEHGPAYVNHTHIEYADITAVSSYWTPSE